MKSKFLTILLCVILFNSLHAQVNFSTTSNLGTEFWTGYSIHQYIVNGYNSQGMTLYLGVPQLPTGVSYATVTVTIDSSDADVNLWWKRIYRISADTCINIEDASTPAFSYTAMAGASGAIPKGLNGGYDARLYTSTSGGQGVFANRGIHIQSDYPIAAYAHIYGSATSAATMLLPINTWGTNYKTINSRQEYSSIDKNSFFVIAAEDSTIVKITPSQNGGYFGTANVPFTILLNKGQIYQYLGAYLGSNKGVELTNSTISSVNNRPIGVFCGSTRTVGEISTLCTAGGGDNDFQQCYPIENWSTEYLLAPFSGNISNLISSNNLVYSFYKIIARDSGTTIKVNDSANINLPLGTVYQFITKTPSKIIANKPVAVAQFMGGENCIGQLGDPEMIYLSGKERSITNASFFRNTKESIKYNYVTMLVPNKGLASLKINDTLLALLTNKYIALHPQDSSYSIVVKGWTANQKMVTIKCDEPFTGYTYGLGSVESYGYNLGANFYLNTPLIIYTKPKIKGIIYSDLNSNGVMDSTELGRANVRVNLSNGKYTFSNNNGYYEIDVDSIGTYSTTVATPNLFMAVPQTTAYNFSKNDTVVTTNIALQPTAVKDSLAIDVIPYYSHAVAGFAYPYFVDYENVGTTLLNSTTTIEYNSSILGYDSCSNSSSVAVPNALITVDNNFAPGSRKIFTPYYTINPAANVGDTLKTVYSIAGGTAAMKDSFYVLVETGDTAIAQRATPAISPTQIANGKAIEYTINYRNLATHSITNLKITDVLSDKLQSNSVEIISSTHLCKATVKGNTILFELLNINLPSVNANKFKSFGSIRFRVKPKTSVVLGDVITNQANLYFDYYNVMPTNITTTIVNATGVLPAKIVDYNVQLMKESKVLNTWQTANEVNVRQYNIQRSTNATEFTTVGKIDALNNVKNSYNFIDNTIANLGKINNLYYRLEVLDNDGVKNYSAVKQVSINANNNQISMYPNPAKNTVTISGFDIAYIAVIDYLGKIIQQKQVKIADNILQSITLNNLTKGIYVVQIKLTNNTMEYKKLIVQ